MVDLMKHWLSDDFQLIFQLSYL